MDKTIKDVLVVEDDLILAMVLVRMLEKLGYNAPEKCHTGQGAIDAFKQIQADLILIDIQLKDDIDGINAIEEIRKISDVPVIYITGNSDRRNIERARKTNFADYLIKPIQLNDLKESISKVFS